MLARSASGQIALSFPRRQATNTLKPVRRCLAVPLVVLALLLALHPVLPAVGWPFGAARTPTMHDPLPVRVSYIRGLVADAGYVLARTPRILTLWGWQIDVRPAQPDPQAAWDDLSRIPPVAVDQPEVLSLLWHIQRIYQRLAQEASYAQQVHGVYVPDYAPVQTLLAVIDTDLAATSSGPAGAASDGGACQVCALE
jgi:hypothetical protein